MKSLILLLVGFLFYVNCCEGQRVYSDEQLIKYLPKGEREFQLSKQSFTLCDTSIISPNAVFVLSEYLCGQKCDSLHTFIRFFSDGKVFVSFPYQTYPKVHEFNDLSYGKYGRYIVKDGDIKIELYMNKQHGLMYMYAKPVNRGIQFYKTTGRGLGRILKVTRTTDAGFYRKDYTRLYNWPNN